MSELTEERIQIIKQLKSTSMGKNRTFENQLKNAKIWGSVNFVFANILLLIVMIISFLTLLHIDAVWIKWPKSGLMVLMTIAVSFHAHYSFIEFLLLNHVKNLKHSNFKCNHNLNMELKNIINDMNFYRFKPYWIIIPAIAVIIGGALTVLELNPYWNWFVLPVLITSVLLSWRLNNSVFQIQKNIEKTKPDTIFS